MVTARPAEQQGLQRAENRVTHDKRATGSTEEGNHKGRTEPEPVEWLAPAGTGVWAA
jgi:hypothetical protein